METPTAQPPVGTIVTDADKELWRRDTHGWTFELSPGRWDTGPGISWADLQRHYGPVTMRPAILVVQGAVGVLRDISALTAPCCYNIAATGQPPEYCDGDAADGSGYCPTHQHATGEADNSDEPHWGNDD